jgi:hypothetical protein
VLDFLVACDQLGHPSQSDQKFGHRVVIKGYYFDPLSVGKVNEMFTFAWLHSFDLIWAAQLKNSSFWAATWDGVTQKTDWWGMRDSLMNNCMAWYDVRASITLSSQKTDWWGWGIVWGITAWDGMVLEQVLVERTSKVTIWTNYLWWNVNEIFTSA